MGIFYKESADYAICQPENSDTRDGITQVTQQISRLRFQQPTLLGRLLKRQPYAQLVEGSRGKVITYKRGSTYYPYRREYTPVSADWSLVGRNPPKRLTVEEGRLMLKESERKKLPVVIVGNLQDWKKRGINLVR